MSGKVFIGIGAGITVAAIITIVFSMGTFDSDSSPDIAEDEIKTEGQPLYALINYRAIGDTRTEDGLAIIDINPDSKTFGDIIQDVPIGENVLLHHPFYNSDASKLYNTSLQGEILYRISLHEDRIS